MRVCLEVRGLTLLSAVAIVETVLGSGARSKDPAAGLFQTR